MKRRLLVVELWGLGDLMIAVPFLRAAVSKYSVTLLAKPFASEVCHEVGLSIDVVPLVAPWTAFHGKYRLLNWPWRALIAARHELRQRRFDLAVSARWDPRDHVLMWLAGARRRLGFPRAGSGVFLSDRIERPTAGSHRSRYWRDLATALGFDLPGAPTAPEPRGEHSYVLVHTGAAQAVRVWPLERYRDLVGRLRSVGLTVRVAADQNQRDWWHSAGEHDVLTPVSIADLFDVARRARLFIGNDSGPGHVAAACGVPTFTIFGPQLPESFVPVHPRAQWIEGRPCIYKPCFDSCKFPEPNCITGLTERDVWDSLERFVNDA